jgi:hypothetical protein
MTKRCVATTDRLAGRVTHILRQHPPPVGGDHLQIPLLGVQHAQQLQLLDRVADPPDRSGLLTELLDRCRRGVGGHDEQLIERVLESGRQEPGSDAAMDLLLGVGAGRGDEPFEHGQSGPQQPLAAKPVDGVSQQRQWPIVAKRTVTQPRAQRLEVGVAAPAKRADPHRLREVLGTGVALSVQARRSDRRQRDVQLACDQSRGRHRQLV